MLHNYENRLIYAANKLSANCTRKRQGVEQLAIDVLLNCAKVSNVSEKSVIICLFYTPFICIVIRLTRKCQRVKFWRAWLWCSNCKLLKRICTLWCGTLSGEARKSEHLPLTGAFAWVTANWLDVCGSCAYSHMRMRICNILRHECCFTYFYSYYFIIFFTADTLPPLTTCKWPHTLLLPLWHDYEKSSALCGN